MSSFSRVWMCVLETVAKCVTGGNRMRERILIYFFVLHQDLLNADTLVFRWTCVFYIKEGVLLQPSSSYSLLCNNLNCVLKMEAINNFFSTQVLHSQNIKILPECNNLILQKFCRASAASRRYTRGRAKYNTMLIFYGNNEQRWDGILAWVSYHNTPRASPIFEKH